MKKMILAGAISAALPVSTLSAATIYEKDDLKLHLKGDLQVQLFQEPGTDEDLDVDYDDLELKFGAKYDLGNGVAAFGELDIDWKNQGDGEDDDVVDDAYVGMTFGAVSISLGRQIWGTDDFDSEKAIELDGGSAFPETDGNDTVKLSYDGGMFVAILAVDIEDSDGDDAATDLFVSANLDLVQLGLAYQTYEEDPSADGSESIDTFGVTAGAYAGPVEFGADFSSNDEVDIINFSAAYPFADTLKGAAGITQVSPDDDDQDEVLHWYANLTKKMHKNVSVFGEIGNSDIDDSDMGFLAGMRVKF